MKTLWKTMVGIACTAVLPVADRPDDAARAIAPPEPDLISVDPNPPVAGQLLTIHYARWPGSPQAIKLDITWTPAGEPSAVTIEGEHDYVTIAVPFDARHVLIEDTTGDSADFSSSVLGPDPAPGGAPSMSGSWTAAGFVLARRNTG